MTSRGPQNPIIGNSHLSYLPACNGLLKFNLGFWETLKMKFLPSEMFQNLKTKTHISSICQQLHSPHFIPSEVWIQPWVSRYISNSNHVILCASMFQQLIKTLPLTFTVCCWDPWTKMATNYTLTQTVSVLLQQNMGRNSGQEQTHTHAQKETERASVERQTCRATGTASEIKQKIREQ